MNTMLIVGATGVVGDAALKYFCEHSEWRVIALSRRPPQYTERCNYTHHAIDLSDRAACRAVAAQLTDVSHVIYAAVAEKPGLVGGWHDKAQMDLNQAMLENLINPLCEAADNLQHISLLQGAKAYGGHAGFSPPLCARESAPRVEHDNFYWLQEDYIREKSEQTGFSWTIFRPQVIVGAAWGAAMNPLLPICAYAMIRREENKPLSYPGGALQAGELVDPLLLTQAFHWAGTAEAAQREIFNFTNGDVFAWCDAWPAIAEAFGMDSGPDERKSLASYLLEREEIWDRVVERENLQALSLKQFLGESHHYADILLRADAEHTARPMLLSTIKLRQAGFAPCSDSLESVLAWIEEIKRRGLIPH